MKKTFLLAVLLMFISALFASPPHEVVKTNKTYVDIGYAIDIQQAQTVNFVSVPEIYTADNDFILLTDDIYQTDNSVTQYNICSTEIYIKNTGYTDYGNIILQKTDYLSWQKTNKNKFLSKNYRQLYGYNLVPTDKNGLVVLSSKYCLSR